MSYTPVQGVGGGGAVSLTRGEIDHFLLAHVVPEKYFKEIWAYRTDAGLLEVWILVNGTFTRVSQNRVAVRTPAVANQTVSLNTSGSMEINVQTIGAYNTLHALVFKTTVRTLVGNQDGFVGLATGVNPGSVLTSTTFFSNLGGAVGFIFGNSTQAGNQIRPFIQIGANQEILVSGVPLVSASFQLEIFVNSSGNFEFFIDGVLVGTSTQSPDPRPTSNLHVAIDWRTKQAVALGIDIIGISASFNGDLNF